MIDPREADARRGYLYGVSEWLDQAGFEVDIEVREGEVIETILKAAHEGYDVILMVRRSSADRRAIAVASVTEGVIKKAPCPVILIPAREG